MFQLTDDEQKELVANCDHLKNLKYGYQNAYAFSEHDKAIAQIITVLNNLIDKPRETKQIGFSAD